MLPEGILIALPYSGRSAITRSVFVARRLAGLVGSLPALNAIPRSHLQIAANLGVNFVAVSLPMRAESKCHLIFLGFVACLHS
jgi:hypothetical protein